MVDALRSAWRVLRRGGLVVDMQPAAVYRPRLAIVGGGFRHALGRFDRAPHLDVVAAHRARRRAIAEGWFTRIVSTHGSSRGRYPGLTELRALLRENENWEMGPDLRRRLTAAWSRRPVGASLEIRHAFSLAVLRKR
jgi:hypothetical protein